MKKILLLCLLLFAVKAPSAYENSNFDSQKDINKSKISKIVFNKKTDFIQIIAPASIHGLEPNRIIESAIKLLQSNGFKVKVGANVFAKNRLLFYSSSLNKRIEDFTGAINDPEVKILWSLCGGYGSAEVANALLDMKMPSDKILIGFSDITALHTFFHKKFLIPSIHGNNAMSLLERPQSIEQIINILHGSSAQLSLSPMNQAAKNSSKIEAIIVGGNLRVLTTLIGTPLMPNFDDKILILEDVSEPGYSIMRSLMQLKYARMLDAVKAIIFADFIKSDEYGEKALQYFSQQQNIPIFRTQQFGHAAHNTPITLGASSTIDSKKKLLVVDSPFEIIDN